MRTIERYEEVAGLLAAQLRPGVRTNALLKPQDLRREAAAGTLAVQEFPGGLILLRRRGSCQRMSFWLQRGAEPPPLDFSLPTALEIAFRPRDMALADCVPLWERAGFRESFSRQRMSRPAGLDARPGGPFRVRGAGPAEAGELEALFAACFDPLTGCLPTREELEQGLSEGRFLWSGGGLLHWEEAPGGTELRHLAVAPEFRRQGAAQALFAAYLERTAGRASRVWVQRDNLPALRFYEKNGYVPDSWTSRVLGMP